MFFKEIEGEAAVIIENGVFKQVPVATRNGYLFAKTSGGYVRIMADGSMSKPKMRLETISWEGGLYRDSLGRLCTETVSGAKALPQSAAQLLLGVSGE